MTEFLEISNSFVAECFICKKQTSLRCSKCKKVYYCNQKCQSEDFKSHKDICCKAPKIYHDFPSPLTYEHLNKMLSSLEADDDLKDKWNKPILLKNIRIPSLDSLITICFVCKTKTTSKCEACKRIFYCSQKCQQEDFKNHKKDCRSPIIYTEKDLESDRFKNELICSNNGELMAMDCAASGKLNRKDGFQGCRVCPNNGFYLCEYSKEGLCRYCEFHYFPERFRACLFCRKPVPNAHTTLCFICEEGIHDWLKSMILKDIYSSDIVECVNNGIYMFLNQQKMWKYTLPPSCIIYDRYNEMKKWPGFHIGNKKWIIPDFKEKFDVSDITWENRSQVIERELIKLGIDIFSDIQCKNNVT